VIRKAVPPESVRLRFDYRVLADGATVNPGKEYKLADDWLVDSSPHSAADTDPAPGRKPPEADELDYALLRVDAEPGNQPIGAKPEPTGPRRGWVIVPEGAVSLQASSPLFILQHPNGLPVKLAFDTESILDVNANRTRVRYKTNTDPGSSGSPCFDINWQLVAVHHSGDPDMKRSAEWNEGIPIDAIVAQVKRRGLEDVWGER
jgi:hypothetical protein